MNDSQPIGAPKISVLTPSLNHGRFLRETIESILSQSFRDFEHIVVDGGSTDETHAILRSYSHIYWIVEKDPREDSLLEAYRKALSLARGDYVIQCCVSDGFLNRNWFRKCVEVLDSDPEVALVWGLPQYLTEDSDLGRVSYVHFLDAPPPQKEAFLPFWLATGFILPEGNYCIRRPVFDACFPLADPPSPFRINPVLGFNYHFNTMGYLPFFLPAVANWGRTHPDQRGQRLQRIEKPVEKEYFHRLRKYRRDLLEGRTRHIFRDGSGRALGRLSDDRVRGLRALIWKHRLLQSPFLTHDFFSLRKRLSRRAAGLVGRFSETLVSGRG